MNSDPYGYEKLNAFLQSLVVELSQSEQNDICEVVQYAMDFYGGVPTEFLGESKLALLKIKNEGCKLSDETSQELDKFIELLGESL